MMKKVMSLIIVLVAFVLMPVSICSAENWCYLETYSKISYLGSSSKGIEMHGQATAYIDLDSIGITNGYTKDGNDEKKTAALVKLRYSHNGQQLSQIWNITVREEYDFPYGFNYYYKLNHVYIYNSAGYLVDEDDCRYVGESRAYLADTSYLSSSARDYYNKYYNNLSLWPSNFAYDISNYVRKHYNSR